MNEEILSWYFHNVKVTLQGKYNLALFYGEILSNKRILVVIGLLTDGLKPLWSGNLQKEFKLIS